MISDSDLLITKYVSVPKDMGSFNPAAFVAGIVKGVLNGAGFPSRVTGDYVAVKDQAKPKITILIKLDSVVMQREAQLPSV